jgi:tmRNA-binding protein
VERNTKNEWKRKGWIKKLKTIEHFCLRYNEDKMTIVTTKLYTKKEKEKKRIKR